MPEIIRTEGIDKFFNISSGTVQALKGISIFINKGTLTILKGRSGSGKTTLMNILGVLDRPSGGRVFYNGTEITGLPEGSRDEIRRRDIGFVFQSVALIPAMSAYENVDFALRLAGLTAIQRKSRAEECLSMVSLTGRMHHRPHELSGGEQQRVAIARAIAHKPGVIFADEPTAELDTHNGLVIVKLFKSLVESEGLTVVMSTHDPGLMEIADHLYELEDGEVINER